MKLDEISQKFREIRSLAIEYKKDKDYDKVFEKAYKNLKEVNFDGIYFRKDIGHQVRKNFFKEN